MNINLSNVSAASAESTSTFKSVKPGVHTLTISKLEEATRGTKSVVRVTFDSTEAEASFNHDFFVTEKALPRVQYLIEKFTGSPLEGSFDIPTLSAALVGKTKTVVVDGEVRPRQKEDRWYNNTYATLRYAGFVDPSGDTAEPRINREQEMNLDAINNPSTETKEEEDNGLPF